ncbi:hypothetical protein IRJ14_20810, partial [Isoptericola sp. QY 916]|nr:hypothetical protein [Isoptericola sp. QY 916]
MQLLREIVYRTPLTTRFRGLDVRDGVLLRGDAGWGELSPFWDYDDAESATWLPPARGRDACSTTVTTSPRAASR